MIEIDHVICVNIFWYSWLISDGELEILVNSVGPEKNFDKKFTGKVSAYRLKE